ncbi:hypothetical protein [Jeotgalicoccus psychrophilus]|uniref:hypothetical protein n=1 Tax=Jeotgalicoccus psychrophilus TaxID=157228 RepID=UPI0004251D4D|nr:hypothetical protein [Jeotgalicoccus psychrophilus]
MKISVENKHVKKVVEFLEGLVVSDSPKASRARVKLQNRLQEKLNEFSIEYMKLNGELEELKKKEDYKGCETILKHMQELQNEISVVVLTEYAHMMPTLKEVLENYSHTLEGNNAVAHDLLLDALEDNLPSSPVAEADNENAELVEEI